MRIDEEKNKKISCNNIDSDGYCAFIFGQKKDDKQYKRRWNEIQRRTC